MTTNQLKLMIAVAKAVLWLLVREPYAGSDEIKAIMSTVEKDAIAAGQYDADKGWTA